LEDGQIIKAGSVVLEAIHIPGHSPGGCVFVEKKQKVLFAGDVLFWGSIGRTDLPGGNYELLIDSIKNRLFSLNEDYIVYSGHGPETTLDYEKKNNPYLI
jgi:glyoxylase-like metal-dependent hydrolase (beta-lactamase superfamily II)